MAHLLRIGKFVGMLASFRQRVVRNLRVSVNQVVATIPEDLEGWPGILVVPNKD